MVDLNSPVWKELRSEDIPPLLRELAEKPGGDTWETLHDALVDQGDVCSAAYAAVPHLIEIAIAQPLSAQVDIWDLIGYVASRSPQERQNLPNEVRRDFAASLTRAKSPLLKAIHARTLDEEKTVFLIEVLADVSGCYGAGRILRYTLCADWFGANCPTCNRNLRLRFGEGGLAIRTDTMLTGNIPKRSWLPLAGPVAAQQGIPSPDEITPSRCDVWLPQVAESGGQPAVAQRIRALYQNVTCPECNCQFPLMEELCKAATIDVDESDLEENSGPEMTPEEEEATQRQIEENTAQVNFFYKLESLPKPEIVRVLLAIAEMELYEGAFSAEVLSNGEFAMSAARAWLNKPSAAYEDEARMAGSRALKLVAGAAATACSRMPELAAKTCVDALMGLQSELRKMAIARIQEMIGRL